MVLDVFGIGIGMEVNGEQICQNGDARGDEKKRPSRENWKGKSRLRSIYKLRIVELSLLKLPERHIFEDEVIVIDRNARLLGSGV